MLFRASTTFRSRTSSAAEFSSRSNLSTSPSSRRVDRAFRRAAESPQTKSFLRTVTGPRAAVAAKGVLIPALCGGAVRYYEINHPSPSRRCCRFANVSLLRLCAAARVHDHANPVLPSLTLLNHLAPEPRPPLLSFNSVVF